MALAPVDVDMARSILSLNPGLRVHLMRTHSTPHLALRLPRLGPQPSGLSFSDCCPEKAANSCSNALVQIGGLWETLPIRRLYADTANNTPKLKHESAPIKIKMRGKLSGSGSGDPGLLFHGKLLHLGSEVSDPLLEYAVVLP